MLDQETPNSRNSTGETTSETVEYAQTEKKEHNEELCVEMQDEGAEPVEASPEEQDEKKENKLFKKKEKTDKKQDKLKEKVSELEDRVIRQMAEFENFRKRSEKEKSAMYDMGAKNVIEKILPVVDNFERGLQAIPEEEKGSAFSEGMILIYKQMMSNLEEIGVKPIEAIGNEFNPDFHNAVMQVENEAFESGTVAQELQKGYLYKESVVRHSMVAVVQ